MKSYLKFLSRNKLYTAIEFIGLSVALAFVIISFCYVVQQYAVTRENPERERIYAVGDKEQFLNCYGMKEVIDGKLPEVIEYPDHPWFIGVQSHPELKSKPFAPAPLFAGFIRAAMQEGRLV